LFRDPGYVQPAFKFSNLSSFIFFSKMPFRNRSGSESSFSESDYDDRSYGDEPDYDCDEPKRSDNDLYYDLEEELFSAFMRDASIVQVKMCYDEGICKIPKSFLDTFLETTLDEHFERLIQDFELRRIRDEALLREQEKRDLFGRFYSNVTYYIRMSYIVEAREFYDAEISQHISFLPIGIMPDAYFVQLVEEDAARKRECDRHAEWERLAPIRATYEHLHQNCVSEMTRYFGKNIRTHYQNFLGLQGSKGIADCLEVRCDPELSFESEYLSLVAKAAKNRVGKYTGRGLFPSAFDFDTEEGQFIPLYRSIEGDKSLFLEHVVPELEAYFSQYLCPKEYITERYIGLASTRPHWPSRVPTEFDISTFVRDLMTSEVTDTATYGDLLFQTVSDLSRIDLQKLSSGVDKQLADKEFQKENAYWRKYYVAKHMGCLSDFLSNKNV
jgi:hypothetical protein